MSPEKTTPPTLARERGQVGHRVVIVNWCLVTIPPMEFKLQCLACDCWFDRLRHDSQCADCTNPESNSNQHPL
jgi:hypothetical protein